MSKQSHFPKTEVLGLEVDTIGAATAVRAIVGFAKTSPRAGYVVRPHVEFIEQALKQKNIMQLLNQAQFCLADGVALQWAAYHLDSPGNSMLHLIKSLSHIPRNSQRLRGVISERVAGIAFTLQLLEACAKAQASVFLVGSPQANPIEHTAKYLQQRFHGLSVVGSFAATRRGNRITISPQNEQRLLKQLKQHKPDVILVGLGFPKQELLMARLCQKLSHGIFIGEGGSFDYQEFGGHIQRAPRSVQRAGLEWLWRLSRQPSRFKRQLAIPRFVARVHRHKKTR